MSTHQPTAPRTLLDKLRAYFTRRPHIPPIAPVEVPALSTPDFTAAAAEITAAVTELATRRTSPLTGRDNLSIDGAHTAMFDPIIEPITRAWLHHAHREHDRIVATLTDRKIQALCAINALKDTVHDARVDLARARTADDTLAHHLALPPTTDPRPDPHTDPLPLPRPATDTIADLHLLTNTPTPTPAPTPAPAPAPMPAPTAAPMPETKTPTPPTHTTPLPPTTTLIHNGTPHPTP
uniref:Uncharacterized protein n=1 Tax=Rhodococcus sp. NS1 TaxID=402236 RepID=Q06G99_9NOCA|nr:hypothetical protein [Rhodococcus sp. NS1]ABI79412.1 hypothetical protein PNSL1.084 [Rhodococcus sp. NS1]